MRDRESWLASTVIELAETGVPEVDEEEYALAFSRRLAQLLSPAEVGLLLPAGPGHPAVATGNTERAVALVRLEASGAEGPCAYCCRTGVEVRQGSLAAAQTRWPEFATAARAACLSVVRAMPMRHNDEAIGAVSVLGARDQLVSEADDSLAQTLIEVATIGITQARAYRLSQQTARQLQRALDSRVVIEQAKGALAARLACTPDDAFRLLRDYARASNRRLTEVAGHVVQGVLPPDALTRLRSARRD
jgi:ANTAR domain-containing protein